MRLFREILDNMCVVIVSYPGCEVINFGINFFFIIKLFLIHDQKVKTKI